MRKFVVAAGACLAVVIGAGAPAAAQNGPILIEPEGDPAVSAGGQGAQDNQGAPSADSGPTTSWLNAPTNLGKFYVDKTYKSMQFDDNAVENIRSTGAGVRFIPPDPIGAAGHSRVVAVVNSMIEARTKSGQLKWREGLRDFFAPLSPPTDVFPFDPKIIYDDHEQRFVVVALEQIVGTASVSPSNVSRILLAVSKSHTPGGPTTADWNFMAINAKQVIPRPVTLFDHWADYPGFEVDEEAIYITANMFTFVPFGSFGGVRLWIVDKGVGAGGFYDGGAGSFTVHNPYASGGIATTTMPAEIRDVNGAGAGIGTYLVSYSGLSDGVLEYVQIVRVDNPLSAPAFTQEFLPIADIENFTSFPDAPQLGSPFLIETNDRRALDAVWHDDALWLTTTITPFVGADANQTTAYWLKLDTSGVTAAGDPAGLIALDQHGGIGGEDIAAGAFTYFPSVAVNRYGSAAFGFSASAPSIYAGAFVAARGPYDLAGTVRSPETVQDGLAPYKRFFGGPRNRWGDYSGISVDPANDDSFWVFNEYAETPGSPTVGSQGPEDGRWGTAWARGKFVGPKN
jgi:hypothetical protein